MTCTPESFAAIGATVGTETVTCSGEGLSDCTFDGIITLEPDTPGVCSFKRDPACLLNDTVVPVMLGKPLLNNVLVFDHAQLHK